MEPQNELNRGGMDFTLIDVSKLSEPLTKFIEVVSQGIGTLYNPVGTVRQAKADAKAGMILANADVEKEELFRRAAARIGHVELERQKNIENVVEKARIALPSEVNKQPVSKDWTNFFFNSCQDVSDADLQNLWAKILATEVEQPGSTPKRTLEFLKTLDKHEAELFEKLLSVSLQDEHGWYFIVEIEATTDALNNLQKLEAKVDIKRHLTDIGMAVSEPSIAVLSKLNDRKFSFAGKKYKFISPPPPGHSALNFSQLEYFVSLRYFTAIGQSLSWAAKKTPVEGFIQILSKQLEKEFEIRIELEI